MALIAIEEHWNLPALTTAVKALPEDRGDPSVLFDEMGDNLERLDDIGDARITAMDAQGVDLQILSLAPPGTHPLEPAEARTLSRRANDIAAEAVSRHPARLRAFATLPMADPKAAVAELERAAGRREVTTADRLLFLTDYPFQRPVTADIEQFLTDDDREKFTAGNACSLFGISFSTK